ncbi:hypothetical protein [Mycobacterium montefiorense]|uniref:hypothetical protein n=1 Tax=Mycobacterium montefiorense TaxID=154654 RepID=UPI0021F3048E|nr:hypothetical protein [Mycobacterium montefiorense]MCV7426051.1 hypothetical protein [Mycobacterium montefiorense]
MSRSIIVGICTAITNVSAAVAITAAIPTEAPVNAAPGTPMSLNRFATDLPTGPDDPRCLQNPGYAACMGGPYWVGPPAPPAPPGPPTGPLDPQCMSMPADAACVGSPYLPPPPIAAPPPPPVVEPPLEPIAPPPIAPPMEPIAPPPESPGHI